MGLDISHDAWHGAYSAFHRYRCKIAELAGMPPLELMEGFYSDEHFALLDLKNDTESTAMFRLNEYRKQFPIKWSCLKPTALHDLLNHSDSDGKISFSKANKIADELERLLPLMKDIDLGGHVGKIEEKTKKFIAGCRLAYSEKKPLKFY